MMKILSIVVATLSFTINFVNGAYKRSNENVIEQNQTTFRKYSNVSECISQEEDDELFSETPKRIRSSLKKPVASGVPP